jgi:UDP-N-acetylmuramyl pentapeptide synthase
MGLIDNILTVSSADDFCIQELGAWGTGTLDAGLELVKPDIGVVLNVRNDHYSNFKGLEQTQEEKSKVVSCLSAEGTAILNADDHYVWDMRYRTRASVLGFGKNQEADLRATRIHSVWPERLSFDLSYRGQVHRVRTQLLGEHLVGSALAAIAIAIVMGIPLRTAVDRLATASPTSRRMSPVFLESGVTFIRDDFKAPYDSMADVVQFLTQAQASRKIAVLGRISDYPGRSRHAYTEFAQAVAEVVDLLVLVGERHEDLWGRDRRGSPNYLADFSSQRAQVCLFQTVYGASHYIHGEVKTGDLIFVKGSGVSDHLERILLQFQTIVRCWKTSCGLSIACDSCEMLNRTEQNTI